MIDDDIKSLIKILEESNIDELEVSTFWGKRNIRLRKNNQLNNQHIKQNDDNFKESIKVKDQLENIIDINEPTPDIKKNIPNLPDVDKYQQPDDGSIETDKRIIIKAPLVGTFYICPKPDEPHFINIGDVIEKGQIFCIIEAMKIFNEIESDFSGKVIDILVDNATPVEYDQDLVVLSLE